jgi:hypothetical protein
MIFCVLALVAANAFATPVQYTSVVWTNADVTSIATAADFNLSPPSALPLITESTVYNDTDYATANSINGLGLLNTYAEASSATGFASATGSAEFTGTFDWVACLLWLNLSFEIYGSDGAGGLVGADLFVTVTNGGSIVFQDVFTTPGDITLNVVLPTSGPTTLDLLVDSTAFVSAGGTEFSGAGVQFSAAVPEPSTWALMGFALLIVFCVTRRQSISNRHLFA